MTGMIEVFNGMLHPGLIMAGHGVLVLLLPRFIRRPAVVIAPFAAAWAVLKLTEESVIPYDITSYIHMEFIRFDDLALIFLLAFCVLAALCAIYGEGIMSRYESGLSLVYAGSAMGVILAGDCISFAFCWEIMIAASIYLVYSGNEWSSAKAAIRYAFIHLAGGAFMLAGFIIYMFHYGNSMENIASCSGEFCYWLIAAGIAIPAAVIPFHGWLTDACTETSPASAVWLPSFTILTSAYMIIRLLAGSEIIVWVGVCMVIFGACMSLLENDIRRLLAYQIVSLSGTMVSVSGAGGELRFDAVAILAVSTILPASVLMMCAGSLLYATGKSKITELGGAARKLPVTSACFLICSLAVTGFPGLCGFVGRSLAMETLSAAEYIIPSYFIIAGQAGTILAIALKLNWFVFFGPLGDRKAIEVRKGPKITMVIAMILGTAASVWAGLFPARTFSLIPSAAVSEAISASGALGYAAVFLGTAISFFVLIKMIKPRDEISLDFDWLVRVWDKRIRF